MRSKWLRAALAAWGFLTKIPVPLGEVQASDLGRSVAFFPAVGIALGGLFAAEAWLLHGHVADPLVAVLVLATAFAVTGGLHLDGLADVFDGLGHAGKDAGRALEIMRDSRIGAHGATALVLLLGGKIAALALLVAGGRYQAIAVCPAMARWCVVPFIVAFPCPRTDGLGHVFHTSSGVRELVLATAIMGGVLAWAGKAAAVPAIAALLAAGAIATWLRLKIGGLTGDGYGALIELSELAFLIGAGAA